MDVKLKLKGSYLDCTTVDIYLYEEECTDYFTSGELLPDGTFDWDNAIYDHTTCTNTSTLIGIQTQCVWVETEDYSDGGGGGGGEYDPNPCNCSTICPFCGGCKLGLLKSANEDCTPCTCPVVDVWDLEQNPKADCIYNKLISGNVLNNFMSRYFGLTEPSHSLLGEIDLYWKIGDLSRYNTNDLRVLAITNPIGSSLNPNYYVEIILDAEELSKNSVSLIAYTMLHEAAHAKLIAEYYDQTGTTDFETLFRKNKNLYGADVQHFTMLLNEYTNELATGVKEFDEMFGVNRSLLFYQRAINYQLREQLGLNQGNEGETELDQLLNSSPKTCE